MVRKVVFLSVVILMSCSKKVTSTIGNAVPSDLIAGSNVEEIKKFQEELNRDYLDPEKSPLSEEQRVQLKNNGGHNFFPTDPKFRFEANLDRNIDDDNIQFKTSTERIAVYDLYGVARFYIDGRKVSLNIYQSHRLREMEEYKDHLFLPFTDLTNGNTTYGGGRYIDLTMPMDDIIVIDFNKAYFPYCAYSDNYSCPIPPRENYVDFAIEAGVKNLEVIMQH